MFVIHVYLKNITTDDDCVSQIYVSIKKKYMLVGLGNPNPTHHKCMNVFDKWTSCQVSGSLGLYVCAGQHSFAPACQAC